MLLVSVSDYTLNAQQNFVILAKCLLFLIVFGTQSFRFLLIPKRVHCVASDVLLRRTGNVANFELKKRHIARKLRESLYLVLKFTLWALNQTVLVPH